jgi:hypothetical protein
VPPHWPESSQRKLGAIGQSMTGAIARRAGRCVGPYPKSTPEFISNKPPPQVLEK